MHSMCFQRNEAYTRMKVQEGRVQISTWRAVSPLESLNKALLETNTSISFLSTHTRSISKTHLKSIHSSPGSQPPLCSTPEPRLQWSPESTSCMCSTSFPSPWNSLGAQRPGWHPHRINQTRPLLLRVAFQSLPGKSPHMYSLLPLDRYLTVCVLNRVHPMWAAWERTLSILPTALFAMPGIKQVLN